VSVGFRDFLRNFNKSKWPNLKSIHLHTNATRWNKEMWESMPNIHPYVKSCEISVDAGTKETYETKTRINGNWDVLLDNLKFISTIPTLSSVKTSFVVQQKNYKEMKLFYDLMYSIFGKKVNVFFGKITNWGTFTDEDFLSEQIWNESHPEYNEFVKEVNSFGKSMGFETTSSLLTEETRVRDIIEKALKKKFRPEFLNRIDEAIVFRHLSQEDIHKIIYLEIEQLQK
jgi:MoaA/NifB/PqqE/SkfB family radical SAM enzyme